ncbi:hypothetical protein HPB48_007322 [Haemaphysalis longicornis]|uniref:Uncharacterized protein n=1 Tax=Haemaphysalis longicornis TaxID=44386 RepID=A0A9J6G8X1_HAELO|nr:hypothetical protein HPB48_007322 [Haemaphysalis longicornis]
MSVPRTWNILFHLLDTTKSKTHQRQDLHRLLHGYDGNPEELFVELQNRYLYIGPYKPAKDCEGAPNLTLD